MRLAFITCTIVLYAPLAYGQTVLPRPDGVKWGPMPEVLVQADGAQFALISGDMKTGPWVIRFKFPAGYAVLPHTHDEVESVTVLSGTVRLALKAAGLDVRTVTTPQMVRTMKRGENGSSNVSIKPLSGILPNGTFVGASLIQLTE